MRKLPSRHVLPVRTTARLGIESAAIAAAASRIDAATSHYAAARRSVWFKNVTKALALMSGTGQRCMYCSGSESAQVEHYRPKTVNPELALDWINLLWICGICNQAKGNRFEETNPPVNPVDDDVWGHFFIDQFGNLTPSWDPTQNDFDQRAKRTIELHNLDRQALQECRQERLLDLRGKVEDSLARFNAGELSREDLKTRALTWFEQPFQPKVAPPVKTFPSPI